MDAGRKRKKREEERKKNDRDVHCPVDREAGTSEAKISTDWEKDEAEGQKENQWKPMAMNNMRTVYACELQERERRNVLREREGKKDRCEVFKWVRSKIVFYSSESPRHGVYNLKVYQAKSAVCIHNDFTSLSLHEAFSSGQRSMTLVNIVGSSSPSSFWCSSFSSTVFAVFCLFYSLAHLPGLFLLAPFALLIHFHLQ